MDADTRIRVTRGIAGSIAGIGTTTLACALLAALPLLARAQDAPQQLPAPRTPGVTAPPGCPGGCPGAAQDLQQLAPPPGMDVAFDLRQVVFKGASVYTDAQLQALVADRIGQRVAFADLQQLAQRVTAKYQDDGYTLARAILPVQEIQGGSVEISIVEGMLGRVTIDYDPATPVSEDRIRAMLAPLAEGRPVHGPTYERTMLLLSDLPGVRPQSTLETGRVAGSNDLVVSIGPAPRVRFNVEVDNFGTKEVGRWRLGGTARVASPFGIGDNLDLRLLASDERLFHGDGTVFGRIAWEAPLGAAGSRFGIGASRVSYNLGGAFEVLDAVGIARIYDAGVMVPVVRQRGQNLFLRGFVDRKELTDQMRAVEFESDKRVHGVGLSWAWERRDGFAGGGYWSSNGALYAGDLKLVDPLSRQADQSMFGRRTDGGFTKMTLQVARLQSLGSHMHLFVALGAQFADKNLDSAEKLALGGPRAVRAYPSSEVLVDEGSIANVELRWPINEHVTPFAFYDLATGNFNRNPGPFDLDNDRTLRGYGLGLNLASRGGFSANATVAWRDTRRAVSDGGDRSPRLFLHLMHSF
ncbi:hypothetical protein LDO26_06825 [Luteimonas sp. BDR2-5]|uniref:ShlB/FhaC/HecB family hemolysin secretion/activation protein n=1 Tax=Proluteimonas luteida TaxID=2878685 RepID=UPI001E56BCF2|nr:ShlB/FhaC/HecB family hemolysin secretion/activation protein [Luteimonas sp. BDR2-5]MCD9027918.1 hypothetical protein [Luteimonas sp. BDR2-5]